jgi:hypothetical protein
MFWPETISNDRLWQTAGEKAIIQKINERKWQWQWQWQGTRQGKIHRFPIGTLRDSAREDMEENIRRRKVGKKLKPWHKTGSAGDASWKPYTPEGAK